MANQKVMFVDDSETALASTRLATQTLPIEVVQYSSAIDALKSISTANVPDLVVTDLNMPDMNGFEFLAALRGNVLTKSIPVLMLTTEKREEMRQKGKELGLTGWIVKPFNAEQLKSAIVRVLRIS